MEHKNTEVILNTFIYVKTQFVGLHYWKEAPYLVQFLRHPHRHIFHVTATFQVFNNNRELEFFMMKERINRCIKKTYFDREEPIITEESCEMIAQNIFEYLQLGALLVIRVEVSEDGENGAIVIKS